MDNEDYLKSAPHPHPTGMPTATYISPPSSTTDVPLLNARQAWTDTSPDRIMQPNHFASTHREQQHVYEAETDLAPAPTPATIRPVDPPRKPVPVAALDDTLLTVSDDDCASLDIVVSSDRLIHDHHHQLERDGPPPIDGLEPPSVLSHYGAIGHLRATYV